MRSRVSLLAILLTLCSLAALAGATVRREEGEALFEFAARFEKPPQVGQPVTIRLMVLDFAARTDSVTVDARVDLPPGWDLVEGETSRRVRTRESEIGWSITVRPTQTGRFELRRSVSIDRGRMGLDEGVYVIPLDLRTDSTNIGATRKVRLETVRDGQRYRYGDTFLVPIDGPEDFTQGELKERARVVSRQEARCEACSETDPRMVTWVAFIDRAGHLRDARMASEVDPKSPSIEATRAALASWSFAPAKARGRGAADWIVVHVPVRK